MSKFSKYYIGALKKYATLGGRASRAEYWYFVLFNVIVSTVFGMIEGSGRDVLSDTYRLAVAIPSFAVAVRRMHDVNKSGWFLLVPVYNFILLIRRGIEGSNRFGDAPKIEAET